MSLSLMPFRQAAAVPADADYERFPDPFITGGAT